MIYDIHAHIAGVEKETNGNYLSDRILRSAPFLFFMKACGFNRCDLERPGIDRRLAERVAGWISESSVDRVVLLAYDAVYTLDGVLDWDNTHMLVSNDYVASLAREYERVVFGASIHPYRKDSLDELKRVADMGACLVKWLPTGQNIAPESSVCDQFYAELARLEMPLLCHTGGERAVVNLNDAANTPECLKRALDAGVVVIAAHCGSKSFVTDECYMDKWLAMVDEYPNLYGDISAFGLPGRAYAVGKLRKNPAAMDRVLYGSDFPVPSMPFFHISNAGLVHAFKLFFERNRFEKPYRLMRASGFDDSVFTRAADVLRW